MAEEVETHEDLTEEDDTSLKYHAQVLETEDPRSRFWQAVFAFLLVVGTIAAVIAYFVLVGS